MPEMPDVVSGEAVAADWGNDIRDRTVQRYADATARDAAVPFPVAGDLAYLDDSGTVTLFDGAVWKSGTAPGVYVAKVGDSMQGNLSMQDSSALQVFALGDSPNLAGVSFGPDPNNAEQVRMRFGGSAPNLSRALSLQYTSDSERILLDVSGTRIMIGGQSVFAGPTSYIRSVRGNVNPPGADVVWNPCGNMTITVPAHWGEYGCKATGSLQVAGGTDTYQVRSRLQINGSAATGWNQSGNSASHALSTCSTHQNGLSGNLTCQLEGIIDLTGGTAPTATKYAEASLIITRET